MATARGVGESVCVAASCVGARWVEAPGPWRGCWGSPGRCCGRGHQPRPAIVTYWRGGGDGGEGDHGVEGRGFGLTPPRPTGRSQVLSSESDDSSESRCWSVYRFGLLMLSDDTEVTGGGLHPACSPELGWLELRIDWEK